MLQTHQIKEKTPYYDITNLSESILLGTLLDLTGFLLLLFPHVCSLLTEEVNRPLKIFRLLKNMYKYRCESCIH